MLKWIASALLLGLAGAAVYATGGQLDRLPHMLPGPVAEALGVRASPTPGAPAAEATAVAARKADAPAKASPGPDSGPPAPGVAVEAATAVSTTSTEDLRAIGTLQSDESVQIASEIAGRVTEIQLAEGAPVAIGDVLVRLDDSLAIAEVDDTQARFNLAQGNLERANSLAKSGNVTERARDEATTNAETSRAALALAKVRLSKHVIRAPFDGVAGIRRVSPGAYITAGQPIVNLEKIDTLKIDFKLPELYLSQVKTGQNIEITVDALAERTFAGVIYAIDPHLDVNGRALTIRARLANPDLILRPGLFARIRVKGQVKRNVVVVPESAIVPRGADKFVYRVENGQVREAKVVLGHRSKGLVEVIDGLAAQSLVVTAGQQKLKDGSRVEIVTGTSSTGTKTGAGGQPGARGT